MARGRPMGMLFPPESAAQYFAFCGRRLTKGVGYRDVGALINYSASALSRALSGTSVPRWEITEAIVNYRGVDVDEWHAFWLEMKACERDPSRWRHYRREVMINDREAWAKPGSDQRPVSFPSREEIVDAVQSLADGGRRQKADDPLHSEAFLVALNTGPGVRRRGSSTERNRLNSAS